MPDTLAHFGMQILVSKAICRQADVRWIGLGCLIPDLPWILQRLTLSFADPIDLRLYVTVQSSLFFCLLLAAALSLQLQAEDGRQLFLLLALNSLFHLLLDPFEIKWGNGTLLAAPFSWQMTRFAWFWPEQLPTLLLSAAGLLVFPFFAWRDRRREIRFIRDRKRQAAGMILLLAYLLLPLVLLNGPLLADSHYAATLQDRSSRAGKVIEFDRRPYRASSRTLDSYSGDQLRLQGGSLPEEDGIISLQGHFIDNETILVSACHVHSRLRDQSSELGIFLFLIIWLVALCEKRIRMVRISP